MVENKRVINSDYIVKFFGLNSQIYKEEVEPLLKKKVEKGFKLQEKFNGFKTLFRKVYGLELSYDLFIKYSYYIQILRLILTKKLRGLRGPNAQKHYYEVLKDDFNEFKGFHQDFLLHKSFKKVYEILDNIDFSYEDLFHDLYQQIIIPVTRHRLGEFYTSSNLVKMMVNEIYKIGKKVLDPSCGSGTFLVEILLKILNSKQSRDVKIDAINNIYGFDVNPIAALTAKVNLNLIILDYFNPNESKLKGPIINYMDTLFPLKLENNNYNLKSSFDLVIGNPPWLTYKDIFNKNYQRKIRELADSLGIKPPSQYITHIELATIFFYAIPREYLKIGGKIFFVITKSVLNGDHCYKFRKFSTFDSLEIWDFPKNYFFNVDHICLKARYNGRSSEESLSKKYPIPTKIYNDNLELQETTVYDSIKLEKDGAKVILPEKQIKNLNTLSESGYKNLFFQGATLVPRTLTFFSIKKVDDKYLELSSDPDILSRAKKNWIFKFKDRKIEKRFIFQTFLNIDLIPFYIKKFRDIFLPINENFEFNITILKRYPKAFNLYNEFNEIYQNNKKSTSKIDTLFSNFNYWNKLTKQCHIKRFIVVYNASGSMIKAAVIDNQEKNVIISSENYYYSTDLLNEAYYLSSILNSKILTYNIKLIKSSRHIHKRPFSFPIPIYENQNSLHRSLAIKGKKYESIVQDLFSNNPKINPSKVRIFLNKKLQKLDSLTKQVVFKLEK
ncbi:MAG: class I SAM-dependent DNA methyltransferase [Candidatus Hodarchaeota archaeon]